MATTKASFNLQDEDLEKLRNLAKARGVTLTQALRQAISDSSFIEDNQDGLTIQTPDGEVQKVFVLR